VIFFWRAHRKHAVPTPHLKPKKAGSANRLCRFEEMEARQLLSVAPTPLHVAATYFEDSHPIDSSRPLVGASDKMVADIFQISYTGGASDTKLTSLTIQCNANIFFDAEDFADGVEGSIPLTILSQSGFQITSSHFNTSYTALTFEFSGFDAGEKLVFSIDLDEYQNGDVNAVVEGGEFQLSTLSASFTAPHMENATVSGAKFYDDFKKYTDPAKSDYASTTLPTLLPDEEYQNDPAEAYMPQGCSSNGHVYTALSYGTVTQQYLPITLSGTVYDDPNANNIHETGEPGIAGVKLTLLELVGGTYTPTGKTTTTDANGDYKFTGLLPGTYRVAETQPDAYLSVGNTPGTVNGVTRGSSTNEDILSAINLEGGDDSIHNDFAEVKPASISGYVYVDADNDGVFDSGESPIANVTVALLDADGNPTGKTVTTNTSGYYSFTGLMPGTYGVKETQPSGYLDGLDTAGTVNGVTKGVVAQTTLDRIDAVALGEAQSGINYNFGELLPASISGYVYVDADNDGVYDSGESPIGNVVVALLDSSGKATGKTTTTDSTGFYRFDNLAPGVYGVKETQPSAYLDGLDTAGTINGTTKGTAHNPGDLIDVITLGSGQSGINYNFGELVPASIAGYVYVDANNNGIYDSGETPIANATLTLLDSSGNSTGKTTTTNSQGYYAFKDLLPGTYGVKETQPSGYFDGLDAAGTIGGTTKGTAHNPGDLIDAIPIVSGDSGIHYDFGELAPATINGRVYADLNNTATFDSGDKVLAGVTIKLYQHGCETIVATTVTDANGKYSFTNLPPGTYCVVEIQPSGYLEGGDQVGTVNGVASGTLDGSNRICSAVLDSGDNGINYDFWEIMPAKISGYVFQDGPAIVIKEGDPQPNIPSLKDGKLTSDDKRLAGVVVKLCDGSGYPITVGGKEITTKTDANGYYEFTGLLPGDYSVIETQPTGYVPGIDTAGSSGGLVVNRYSKVEASTLKNLAVDASGSAIVRIKINSGDTSVRNNFSEVLIVEQPDSNPPYIPPPTPTPITPPPAPLPYTNFQPAGIIYAFVPDPIRQPLAGGGSGPSGYTWHLSVIDAGQPRQENSGNDYVHAPQNTIFDPMSWSGADLDQSRWILADKDGNPIQTITFGMSGAIPVTGDWLGSGVTKVGVFLDGLWFLDLNGNGVWDKDDLWVKLGAKADKPVSGDWDGDGKTDIGIFGPAWIGDVRAIAVEPGLPDALNSPVQARPKNVPPDPADAAVGWRTLKKGHNGRMRSDVIDHVFQFGVKGDIPVVGDWNGDAIYAIGIFRNGTWFLDMDGDGRWSKGDIAVEFGQDGDLPVVGDWTGDGISKLGVYRDGKFYLDTNNNRQIDATDKVFALGHPGDKPVSGDWNGDGVDEVGVYEDGAAAVGPVPASK
jgi:serine-aspartate repeat-containing protein C/D/E